MIEQKDVTIIIPHLGGSPETEYALNECLKSLEETVPNIKKTIVYNGSFKKFLDMGNMLEGNYDEIILKSQGQCKAVNAAVATTNTPWIFVTNDDMVYPLGWFEKLTAHIFHSEGCISPQLVEPRKGAPTFLEYFCGGAGGDFDKQKFLDFVKEKEKEEASLRSGFNLPFLIKRELWDLVGGYDINYDPWGSNSDSDLEYKIRLAGVQPLQDTGCKVYHFSQTSGTFHPDNSGAWQTNWDYFIKKWGFPRTDEGIWEANFKMPTIEQGRIFKPEWEGKYGSIY